MTREALTGPPPEPFTARCVVCHRRTTAPVAVRHTGSPSGGNAVTLYACPAHASSVAPGPFGDEFAPEAEGLEGREGLEGAA
ncbi:hypothetical protein [Streptomyces sp. NPDC049906]|uniref:hypothetical protein n=1 Tax=Streptomyces sp. NPDC049906 TaxID=3155656 RepID=UPI003423E277